MHRDCPAEICRILMQQLFQWSFSQTHVPPWWPTIFFNMPMHSTGCRNVSRCTCCVCACTWRPEHNLGWFSSEAVYLPFWDGVSLTWYLLIKPDWLMDPRSRQDVISQVLGSQASTVPRILRMVLGMQLRSSCLQSQLSPNWVILWAMHFFPVLVVSSNGQRTSFAKLGYLSPSRLDRQSPVSLHRAAILSLTLRLKYTLRVSSPG